MYKGRSSGRLSARFDSVPAIPDWRSRFSYFLAGIIKSPVSSKFINFLQHLKALVVWKYPACVRKLHPRTSLFHPEVLFLRSIRTDRGNIRPAFGNYTREQAFFTRKFFSSGRFAPVAEISGLRSETTPANKPFSPGSSFPSVDSRRPRKYPACVWKLHPRTSLFHPEVLFLRSIRAGRGNIRPAFGNYTREQALKTRLI
jgi:hypothetical protein